VESPVKIPAAAYLGLATIALVLLWKQLASDRLQIFPKELLAIMLVTACATIMKLPVQHVSLPTNIFAHLNFSLLGSWQGSGQAMSLDQIIRCALAVAMIASAETLLSANAVDRLHQGKRANYDKELFAQGVGNALCGMVGALPMTGVIMRSSVNVYAGARTRLSAILHGVWLFVAAVCLPSLLSLVPISCLAAILVLTAVKLIDLKAAKKLYGYGVRVFAIYIATIATIVLTDLLTGVTVGVVLSLVKLLYTMSRLDIHLVSEPQTNRVTLQLQGAATLVSLPKLAEALEQIPPDCQLHISMDHLDYLDHACFELIKDWERQHRSAGGVAVIDCSELTTVLRLKSRRRLEHNARVRHSNAAPAPALDHVATSLAN
jgi:MFS superfamily sulfate permease-like transporter